MAVFIASEIPFIYNYETMKKTNNKKSHNGA